MKYGIYKIIIICFGFLAWAGLGVQSSDAYWCNCDNYYNTTPTYGNYYTQPYQQTYQPYQTFAPQHGYGTYPQYGTYGRGFGGPSIQFGIGMGFSIGWNNPYYYGNPVGYPYLFF